MEYISPKTSGEGGIRTLGNHEGCSGFRDRPVRPLRHLSVWEQTPKLLLPRSGKHRRINESWVGKIFSDCFVTKFDV